MVSNFITFPFLQFVFKQGTAIQNTTERQNEFINLKNLKESDPTDSFYFHTLNGQNQTFRAPESKEKESDWNCNLTKFTSNATKKTPGPSTSGTQRNAPSSELQEHKGRGNRIATGQEQSLSEKFAISRRIGSCSSQLLASSEL
ncbi:uncharacterized protein LOC110670472 isoform X3 [Hevea brasiliensis]|uniref:uncharacterized protein LOC110670472 isoform X3 n=1 Tax=Hevea brasiliensis TaxID=3981 RepID=UPI0025D123B6|nr:uncharacterized protein LOC110670472 isoform X3 [Hevea brasiliensis]